jgi:magnesium chelatase family protein
MLVKIYGSAIHGVSAQTITIEVNVDSPGIGYHLVGLPDNAIKESSYRINAALKNVGFKIPGKKITINMAPADLRKEGSAYDLSLAIAIPGAIAAIAVCMVNLKASVEGAKAHQAPIEKSGAMEKTLS